METQRILIRVDGGSQIGMGHVMRCLTLARQMQEMAPLEIRFAAREGREAAGWIRGQGFEADPVPASATGPAEIAWMQESLRRMPADAVLTDLRELTPGIPEAIREAGPLCVTIDEWGGKRIPSDILTNGTIVPAWHRYELAGNVRCYIGARYALLDRQFEEAHDRPRPPQGPAPRLLVALGGDDPFFLTAKTLRILEQVEGSLAVIVVIGPAFLDGPRIRELAFRSRHRVEVLENVSHMAELMMRSDAAVVAGGLIALEMACAGTPGFILCEVDHQLDTASVLEERGAAVNWGLGGKLDDPAAARDLQALLRDAPRKERMSRAGRDLVDGRGTRRVARAILDLLKSKERTPKSNAYAAA